MELATLSHYVKVADDSALKLSVNIVPKDDGYKWFSDRCFQELLVIAHKVTTQYTNDPSLTSIKPITKFTRSGELRVLYIIKPTKEYMQYLLVRSEGSYAIPSLISHIGFINCNGKKVIPYLHNPNDEPLYKYYQLISMTMEIYVDSFELTSSSGVVEINKRLNLGCTVSTDILSYFKPLVSDATEGTRCLDTNGVMETDEGPLLPIKVKKLKGSSRGEQKVSSLKRSRKQPLPVKIFKSNYNEKQPLPAKIFKPDCQNDNKNSSEDYGLKKEELNDEVIILKAEVPSHDTPTACNHIELESELVDEKEIACLDIEKLLLEQEERGEEETQNENEYLEVKEQVEEMIVMDDKDVILVDEEIYKSNNEMSFEETSCSQDLFETPRDTQKPSLKTVDVHVCSESSNDSFVDTCKTHDEKRSKESNPWIDSYVESRTTPSRITKISYSSKSVKLKRSSPSTSQWMTSRRPGKQNQTSDYKIPPKKSKPLKLNRKRNSKANNDWQSPRKLESCSVQIKKVQLPDTCQSSPSHSSKQHQVSPDSSNNNNEENASNEELSESLDKILERIRNCKSTTDNSTTSVLWSAQQSLNKEEENEDEEIQFINSESVVKELITVSSGEEDENSPFSSTTAKKRKLGPMMWAKMKEIFGSYSKMEEFSERTIQQWLKMRKRTLVNVLLGKIPTERHELYNRDRKGRASLQHRVSSVMFSDHQLKTLTEGLFRIFCSKNDQFYNYMWLVLFPESIIYMIMDFYHLDYAAAEYKMFHYYVIKAEDIELDI